MLPRCQWRFRLVSSTPLRTSGGLTFTSKAFRKSLQACSPMSDCRFSINATKYTKHTLLVYTSHIQDPQVSTKSRRISTRCHHASTTTVLSTFSSCSLAVFRSFLSSVVFTPPALSSHTKNAMGQIEAYLAKDLKREPYDVRSSDISLTRHR
ncbi:hypothetical protein ARMGADRAFT_683257 [Armillaria gallica]|uniref:Uncharacterized protein n=1 Tax=Armillaria gallica TaxID=47427 RepID=A0A2H3CJ06_ARMGA|nr:hypothetical protein ARMGADRAFT_683257 [Armillaria gallica]